MNVLSLFDGMSCGRIALERGGIKVDNYFACEIDKYAIQVSKHNWDDIQHLGDVTKLEVYCLPKIDLLIAGSPCQGFSFAGKQLNFEDPRSKLFFEFVRILKDIRRYNPDVLFFLENVKMKKEYQDVISDALGIQPISLNSLLVSAQNRERIYWTNIPFYGQPQSTGKIISDILDVNVSSKHYLKNSYNSVLKLDTEKLRLAELFKNLKPANPTITGPYCISQIENDTPSKRSRQTDRLYCTSSKSPCLTASGASRIKFDCGSANPSDWRYITRTEAEKLQTVPVGYTAIVSEEQAFKMLGNGWNVETILHFFKWLKIIDEL